MTAAVVNTDTGEIVVPGFVWRGLRLLTADLTTYTHGNEADLRDGLAAMWWLHGAKSVRTEVAVQDCGRIDVLVEPGDGTMDVWEIKRTILTVSVARKAYQQAATYRRYLSGSTDLLVFARVAAADIDDTVCVPASRAFSEVTATTVGAAMHMASVSQSIDQNWQVEALRRQRARADAVAALATRLRMAEINLATSLEDNALAELEGVA